MENKLTLTIGIPAYNEVQNIGYLIKELLEQNSEHYVLDKIIVSSDASTDGTDEAVKAFANPKVSLLSNKVREGQGAKQNQIIRECTSDVLVLLNADILISNKDLLDTFAKEIKDGNDLICGPLLEIEPKSFIEKAIAFGSTYRRRVFAQYKNGLSVFTCHGSHRAMSRNFYSRFLFKGSIAEDAYSYLWCLKNGYKYSYDSNAFVYIKVPSNLNDHIRQSSRFFISGEKLNKYFDESFLKQNYKWPISTFFKTGIQMFFETPIEAITYAAITFFIVIKNKLGISDRSDTWQLAVSSKEIKK